MGKVRDILKKKRLVAIVLGQFLSVVITSTGFTSSELARKGINAPTSQSFLNYVLLAIVYGLVMLLKKKQLKAKWYFYVILGLIDVEANFLVVKAYQYTSLTSVMLLDCWAIPCVIILTWIFLKTKYGWRKLVGVAVCVLGLVLVVFSDVYAQDRKERGSNPLKGDLFVIAGATLYGVSNVSEEYLVKKADTVELMAMLGVFGAIISAIQISILERTELKSIHWSAGASPKFPPFGTGVLLLCLLSSLYSEICWYLVINSGGWIDSKDLTDLKKALPFVGFAVAMFLFYSLVPVLLKISGSTMLNLSLLTSDMWSVVIRIFAYHEKVDWLYYVAFVGVAVGLVIYSWGDKVEEKARGGDVAKTEEEGSRRHDEELDVRSSNLDVATGSFRRGPSFDVEHKDEVRPSVS